MKRIQNLLFAPGIGTAFVLLLFSLSCGDKNPPAGPDESIAFISDNPNPGSNSVALQQQSSSVNSLTLRVRMVAVQNVYGAAFEITYPHNLIEFRNFAPGVFLSKDGAPASIQVAENPAGNLIIGATRLGDVGGVGGSGDLLSLTFEAVGTGQGRMDFHSASLRDPDNNIIPGVAFIGGSVTVIF